MYIYIIMLVISLIFTYFYMNCKDNKKIKTIFAILSALPFVFISAIRYDVGTDYLYRYVPDFLTIKNGGHVANLELGFTFLDKICLVFSKDYSLLFFLTSIIIIAPVFYIIYKKSKNPMLSIFLFFTGGFFFLSMNMIRQFIAVMFAFISYNFLLSKQYLKWFFFLIIGSLFHTSIIVFSIVILLCKKFVINFKFLFIATIFVLITNSLLRELIINVFSVTRFSVYIDTVYSKIDVKEFMILINVIIYLVMYYICFKNNSRSKLGNEDIFFMNMQGMAVIISLMGSIFSILSRLIVFFSIFECISIPYILSKYKEKNKVILVIIIVLLFSFNIFYTNVINNDNGVTPYKTIYER